MDDIRFGWDDDSLEVSVANSLAAAWNYSQRNDDMDDDGFLMSNYSNILAEDIFINNIPIQQVENIADSDIVSQEMVLQPSDSSSFNVLQQHQALMAGATTTGSLVSLECLLPASGTNSNTDTSVTTNCLLSASDCSTKSLIWSSFAAAASSTTVSSGDQSENYKGASYKTNTGRRSCGKDYFTNCPLNELDETVSQTSSDHHHHHYINNINGINQSQTKPSTSSKRLLMNCGYLFNHLQTDQPASSTEGGFRLIHDDQNQPKAKKPRSEKRPCSSNINFQQPPSSSSVSSSIDLHQEPDPEAIAQMKEMIYRAAAFRPLNLLGLEEVVMMENKTKRKNARISTDPQTVAARQRRERISERIRVLQRMVPGGTKMDTASILDEAANYLKFLRIQVKALENIGHNHKQLHPNLAFSSLPFKLINHSLPMQPHNFPLLNYSNHIHHYPQS